MSDFVVTAIVRVWRVVLHRYLKGADTVFSLSRQNDSAKLPFIRSIFEEQEIRHGSLEAFSHTCLYRVQPAQ